MSITCSSGKIIVEFGVNGVSGSPAIGAYILRFSVTYNLPPHEKEIAYFQKTAMRIYVGKDNHYLGLASPEMPKTFKPCPQPQSGNLLYEAILSKESLEEIEKLRLGGDLRFKLDIIGEYYDGLNLAGALQSVGYIANQKEWITAIQAMGFRGGLVFELPMDLNLSDEVKSSLMAIQKAREHLHYGNYDDVVAKCRIALESLLSKWVNINCVREKSKSDRKTMSKTERLVYSIDQIVNLTHLAHHLDDESKYVSFNRSEAVFVLGATISALSSYSEYKNTENKSQIE